MVKHILCLFLGSNQYWSSRMNSFCVCFMSGTPGGSTISGSGLNIPEMGPQVKVSSVRLVKPEIELWTPEFKVSDLSAS